MENNTMPASSETFDIEQMRQEMTALKTKLSEQEIINEQFMRHTMKSRMSWINSYVIAETVAAPLLIIVFFLIDSFVFSISPWLLTYTLLIFIGNIIYDWHFSFMKDSSLLQGDLTCLRKRLVGMKHRIRWENIVSIVIIAIWIAWFFLEIHYFVLTLDHDSFLYRFMQGVIYGGAIGFVAGLVIALLINRKIGRTYSNIIAQIDELLTE